MSKFIVTLIALGAFNLGRAEELHPYFRLNMNPMITESAHVSGDSPPAGSSIEFDLGFTVSTAAGIAPENAPLRVELEYNFVKYFVERDRFEGYTGGDKLIWHTYMGNLYYDFRTASRITPFLMVGAGYADAEKATSSILTYQLGAGFGFEVDRHITLETGYRYFSSEHPKLEASDGFYKTDFSSHLLLLGLRYEF